MPDRVPIGVYFQPQPLSSVQIQDTSLRAFRSGTVSTHLRSNCVNVESADIAQISSPSDHMAVYLAGFRQLMVISLSSCTPVKIILIGIT